MSAFYGPESPRPFAVISEQFQNQIALLRNPTQDESQEMYSFGEIYNKALCDMIARLAEVSIDDRTCYVGPKKGSMALIIEEKLKLIHPIQEIHPGDIIYQPTDTDRLIPVKVINNSAEEYFENLVAEGDTKLYDKVIMRDSMEYIQDRKTFFNNAMNCLKPQGTMLVIQRPAEMTTLPYFTEARQRIMESDVPYMDVINDIQSLGFDVEWDVELLPVHMSRRNWLTLLYHRYPNQLEITSSSDVFSGIRELSEGSMKYLWDELEFNDRLLFIVITNSLANASLPECKRFGGSVLTTEPAPLIFHLPVTTDIEPYVRSLEERRKKRTGRDEWFGTIQKEKWENVDSKAIPSKRLNRII